MYRDTLNAFSQYWREYGGIIDLLRSPFAHFSFVVTALYAAGYIEIEWRQVVRDSLPTVLGFSLAAYTITFTLMGSALHRALTLAIDKKTGFRLIRIVNATFFHVVVFQAIALLYALLTKGSLIHSIVRASINNEHVAEWLNRQIAFWGDVLGCFFAVYAFFLLLSVGVAMFRLGRISPPVSVANANNNDSEQRVAENAAITATRRFKFIAWLSKRLGLYG